MSLDLHAPWYSQPVVCIDTETTGLSPAEGHAIVDIAAVKFERGAVVARFSSLINPGRSIPPEVTKVHGISDAMVADAPTLVEIAGKLAAVCADSVPCAYNSTFDRAFLHATITGTDCPAFDPAFPGWICPLVAIREVDRYVAGSGRHKLENVCKRWGVELDGAHRALSDATATGHLLFRLLERKAIRSCSLKSMLETTERKRAQQERDFQEYRARQARKEGAA